MLEDQGTVGPFSNKSDWPYYWLTRVSARYVGEMEKLLKPAGLDVSRWRVLSSLREHGTLGVKEISEFCILKLTTTTKIVQRMTADGLVTTRSSPQDGRVTEVQLTKKGEDAAIRAAHFAKTVFDRTFEGFQPDEIAQMNQLLRRVFDKLG
ncbi:winged helix-turn-helix transcriptional regulator [Rhizobium sp. KVB221]|uniref:Winged helix-turn-helix transcriptional regulator n=1 Tax=Rhizobium setariae TaxID=2801340 RepID=A0A937CQ04_9HYPH|nr:MarR family winged helix-turn-helix transcriptional regulator [Rhizobium setariae]MBL0375531.1 winged helix-turn-helix transcriptional regulator [Rhizobium setariae]